MLRQRRVIWFALLTSTIIYFAMIFMITRDRIHPSFDDALRSSPLILPLYVMALVIFLGAMFGLRAFRFGGNAQLAMVVKLALFEASAIFGLMAAFIAHDWRLFLAPWALALMGFLREWPTEA